MDSESLSKAWTGWTLWKSWTQARPTRMVSNVSIHFVHKVHSVHALSQNRAFGPADLGSTARSLDTSEQPALHGRHRFRSYLFQRLQDTTTANYNPVSSRAERCIFAVDVTGVVEGSPVKLPVRRPHMP